MSGWTRRVGWLAGALGVSVLAAWSAGSAPAAKAPEGDAAKAAVTYNRDVGPLLLASCAGCHRPGEVAPFPLLTYADAKRHARQIAVATEKRLMPPWKASAGPEVFHDARRLSDEQIALLRRWVDAGTPEGRAADRPAAPKFANGWMLGEPDAVVQPPEAYALAAEGRDDYRCFVVPTDYPEDRFLSALEFRPENRGVVHHVIAFVDTTGTARKLDEKEPGPGYSTFGGVGFAPSGFLGGWAPGNFPRHLPEGVGIELPKGADIVLQVHYHKSGKPETDRTRVGLHFSEKPVDKRLRVSMVAGFFLQIPPGAKEHPVKGSLPVPADVTVVEVLPHMHLLGREIKVTATPTGSEEKTLVHIPDWDFNWQGTYAFKEPVKLPRGSRVELSARFDNSAENPRNPSKPPRPVGWGEQTTDEMCLAFLFYTVDAEHLTKGIAAEGFGRGFGERARRGPAAVPPPNP